MPSSLLWQPRRPARPVPVYLLLSGSTAAFYALVFTINLVYQATVVGLSPFQLVLVGTVLEVVAFTFEVPTGIVADLYSRRLSIIIGTALIGCGFVLEGAVPTFAAVLGAQVLWGIGVTFTSGATDAWITDEADGAPMAPIFLRAAQLGQAGTIAGILLTVAFGLVSIRLPILLGGIGFLALAGVLLLVMPERHFHRTPAGERSTLGHMAATFRDGTALARRRPVVRTLLLISLVGGLASEAFDRLWRVHVMEAFRFPEVFGSDDPVVWFPIVSLAGALLGLAAAELVRRVSPEVLETLHPARLLTGFAIVQVLCAIAFPLAGNLWLLLGILWAGGTVTIVAAPVNAAWMNRHLDSRIRATVLSMEGQSNAIGQVVGGPALGLVGSRVSVRAALLGSALVLSPVVALYAHLREGGDAAVPEAPAARSGAEAGGP